MGLEPLGDIALVLLGLQTMGPQDPSDLFVADHAGSLVQELDRLLLQRVGLGQLFDQLLLDVLAHRSSFRLPVR
jgi:hypothetical protein